MCKDPYIPKTNRSHFLIYFCIPNTSTSNVKLFPSKFPLDRMLVKCSTQKAAD